MTPGAKLVFLAIFAVLCAVLAFLIMDLVDFRSSESPEYVMYKWVIVVLPQPKPWFPWL